MKSIVYLFILSLSVVVVNAQCPSCVFHEVDPITNMFVCELPSTPVGNCLVSVDTCFSGTVSNGFFNTPIVDDAADAEFFTVAPNMTVTEIEWCIVDQAQATMGAIQVGPNTYPFIGAGNGATTCGVETVSLAPGVHSFTISANVAGLNLVNWKLNLTLSSCPSMVNLVGTESGVVDTESGDWITSNQTLLSGAVIDYDAVDSIVLLPNFHAHLGSVLSVFIDGCGGVSFDDQDIESK